MKRSCSSCGYEQGKQFTDDGDVESVGDEKFVHVSGNFHTRDLNTDHHKREISLLGCPKCNTIMFERKW